MARPKQYPEDRIQAQIRFMPDVHARLRAQAEIRLVSVAYLVEQAVLAILPEWEAETKSMTKATGNGKAPTKKVTKKVAPKTPVTKAAAPTKRAPSKRAVKAAVPA
jgi:hypothetical protein